MSATIEPGAVYHALPTAPHDDDRDSEIAVDDSDTESSVTDQPVDNRILWVYFMLGCATLLPWNGAFGIVWSVLLSNTVKRSPKH